jgi:hypothetical protein
MLAQLKEEEAKAFSEFCTMQDRVKGMTLNKKDKAKILKEESQKYKVAQGRVLGYEFAERPYLNAHVRELHIARNFFVNPARENVKADSSFTSEDIALRVAADVVKNATPVPQENGNLRYTSDTLSFTHLTSICDTMPIHYPNNEATVALDPRKESHEEKQVTFFPIDKENPFDEEIHPHIDFDMMQPAPRDLIRPPAAPADMPAAVREPVAPRLRVLEPA